MDDLIKEMTLEELTNEEKLKDRVRRAREALLEQGIKIPEPTVFDEGGLTCDNLSFGASLMYSFALRASELHMDQASVDWYIQAGNAYQTAWMAQCPS